MVIEETTDQPTIGMIEELGPNKAQTKQIAIWAGLGALVALLVCLVVYFLVFYLPKPTLDQTPGSTKESKITLKGTTRPKATVVAFDAAGNALLAVNADEQGKFAFADLPVGEGRTDIRLRAVNAWRKSSAPLLVTIDKDTTAPALSVNSPQGAQVTGSNTVISGKAEPGSTVTINGVKTTVASDGAWTATVALQTGQNTLAITATDAAGNVTTQTQTVAYTPTAQGSQTGTATVTTSTVSVSPGSLPATSATSTASNPSTAPTTNQPTQTGTAPAPTQPAPVGTVTPAPTTPVQPTPPPAPQPILGVTASAWVSNPSPNTKANETVYVSVKDNYGRPVTDAVVAAAVMFKTGTQTYTLASQGNGTYAVSFKLNDKYVSGYRVAVGVSARYQQYTATANTSFTPN